MGQVLQIYTATEANAPMQQEAAIRLEAGKGIVGDRYYADNGTFSARLKGQPDKELTLIEAEQVDAFNAAHGFNYNYGDFRRNVVTQGIDLNALEGREFSINGLRLRGIRLCEPCAHLARVLTPEVVPGLLHKAGLRAQVLDNGQLRVGDVIDA